MLARARTLLRHSADPVIPSRDAGRGLSEGLSPVRMALVGGLVVATVWTSGAALAQVAKLARDAMTYTSKAPTAASAPADPRIALEVAAAKRKADAETEAQRSAVLIQARALAEAAQGVDVVALSSTADAGALLDSAEQAVQQRSARLKMALKALGLKASTLPPSQLEPSMLIKVGAPGDAGAFGPVGDLSRRLERVAKQVRDVQLLSASAARLPIAAPVEAPVLSSSFGGRSDPFTGASAFHAGQDFSGAAMTRIEATAPGVVAFTGQRSGYGNTVEVDHGGGFKTRYAHLAAITVRVGQAVRLGDKLGGMGSTGRSTGTHLHYEVWVNGTVQNPERFLRAGDLLRGLPGFERWAKLPAATGTRPHRLAANVRHHGRVHMRFQG